MVLAACSSSSSSNSAGGGGAASGAATSATSAAKKNVKVGLAYDVGGRGDKSFNDLAAAGLEKAKADLNIQTKELSAVQGETDQQKADRLTLLATSGYNPIIAVGFAYATALGKVAPKFPNVHFAIVDDASLKDVTTVASLTFAEEQGSYLVGVAAAKKSTTGKVAFIGGVNTPLIQKFQAGFEAGVKATNPSATVTSKYITEPPDFSGFNAPDKGETIATGMYNDGIDVIYAAAGGSGAGVFKAAKTTGNWAIGVDSDQYNVPSLADVKDVIITSMLKKVDVATWDFIASAANGAPIAGQHVYSLENDGVGYSTSGGLITEYVPDIEKAEAGILDGSITVPSTVGG